MVAPRWTYWFVLVLLALVSQPGRIAGDPIPDRSAVRGWNASDV